MDFSPALRFALDDLGMVDSLAADEVDDALARYRRVGDVGRRGLAFYLLEVDERRLYQHFAHNSTYHFAKCRHDLSPRRTRELMAAGRALRELPLVDEAFCAQELNWTHGLLLHPIVVPETQEAWIEKAKSVSTKELRREGQWKTSFPGTL